MILLMLQTFPSPEFILSRLEDVTIEAWTEQWRTQVIIEQLHRVDQASSEAQLSTAVAKMRSVLDQVPSVSEKAVLIRKHGLWKELWEINHGGSFLLALCDPNQVERGSKLLACALVYAEHTCLLIGATTAQQLSLTTSIANHVSAIHFHTEYSTTLEQIIMNRNWDLIERFFASLQPKKPKQDGDNEY